MPQARLERLKIDEWDRMIDVSIRGCRTVSLRRCST
jgi:NADP-dependent 3-hydroxy acid dehydrogenase YdfG